MNNVDSNGNASIKRDSEPGTCRQVRGNLE